MGQPMIVQQPVIIPQQLQLQQQEIQLLQQQQQQQQQTDATTTKKPKKSKKKKKEKVKEGEDGKSGGKTGTSAPSASTPQPLFTVSVPGTTGTASLAPMGIPTTTLVGSNNMQLVGSNQHIQVSFSFTSRFMVCLHVTSPCPSPCPSPSKLNIVSMSDGLNGLHTKSAR